MSATFLRGPQDRHDRLQLIIKVPSSAGWPAGVIIMVLPLLAKLIA
jgi:hypothetical protein